MTIQSTVNTDLSMIYQEIADFFTSSPSMQQISELRLSEQSNQLISDLLEVNRTRGLTAEEDAALDEYTVIEYLMQAIKLSAFEKLHQGSSS